MRAPAPRNSPPSSPRSPPTQQSVLVNVTTNLGSLFTFITKQVARLSPLLNYAWLFGSTAVLLTLPVLVEIQRETTVLVLQRQKEQEMAQLQEQAKAANAGVVDQLKNFGSLVVPAVLGAGGEGK